MEKLLGRLLAKDRHRRTASAAEVVGAIDAVLDTIGPNGAPRRNGHPWLSRWLRFGGLHRLIAG